jgi:hypothetical protein
MKTLHVIGLATALTLSAMHNARSAEPTPAPGEEVTKAYTRSILADYSFPCKEAVEADAYNLRWTNGWFEFPFNSWAKRLLFPARDHPVDDLRRVLREEEGVTMLTVKVLAIVALLMPIAAGAELQKPLPVPSSGSICPSGFSYSPTSGMCTPNPGTKAQAVPKQGLAPCPIRTHEREHAIVLRPRATLKRPRGHIG